MPVDKELELLIETLNKFDGFGVEDMAKHLLESEWLAKYKNESV